LIMHMNTHIVLNATMAMLIYLMEDHITIVQTVEVL
jgi:hypothetical protein